MAKLVYEVGQEIRKKPVLMILVWLCWVGLFIISIPFNVEDYQTSVAAYRKIPTAYIFDLAALAGALPSLILITGTVVAVEQNNSWATIITFGAFWIDLLSDVYFRCNGIYTWQQITISAVVSFVFFTVGSELLLVVSAENAIAYLPDFMSSCVVIIWKVKNEFDKLDTEMAKAKSNNKRSSSRRRSQQEEFDMP